MSIHHVVVLKQTLTDTEVILFHTLLRILDRAGYHRRFDTLALFQAEFVEEFYNLIRGKQTHNLVFERHIEHGRTRVTLTAGTTAQLTVHTAGLVTLGTDDSQTAGCFHFRAQLDVGTTTCHVGGNGNNGALTCLCYNIRLLLVEFGVEHIVRNATHLEHTAKQFGDFH